MAKSTGKPKERQVQAKRIAKRRQAPGMTIQSREDQIIRLAYDLVEERILKKTATSQEVTEFIRLGSTKAQLERERLKQENALLVAKTQSLESQKRIEEMYAKAMKSFKKYSGQSDDEEVFEDEDD
jgi:hypothetical protein